MQGSDSGITFGYWAPRGKGELVRLILEYTGVKYHDKFYSSPAEWFGADRDTLGFDFPNLPYFIDGDTKITETNALIVHTVLKADRPDLLGTRNIQKVKKAMLEGIWEDLWKDFTGLIFNKEFATIRDKTVTEKIHPRLEALQKFLGEKKLLCV